MFVVLTYSQRYRGFSEDLTPGLRTYWGQRGIAVHHMNFQQTAKEAAVAAGYHLVREAPPDLNQSINTGDLVHAIWALQPVSYWASVFVARAGREVDAWVQKDLNFVVLLTGVHEEEYPMVSSVLGPHMKYEVGPDTHGAENLDGPTEEWGDAVQKDIVEEFSRRMREGFSK